MSYLGKDPYAGTVPWQDWLKAETFAIIEEAGYSPTDAIVNLVLTSLQALGLRAASELNTGVAKLATQALIGEGLDDSTIITPKKLADASSSGSIVNSWVRRDANGNFRTNVPIHDNDVTRKIDVANAIAALVDTSPATLDTLNELAAALGDDPNFATTVTNALAGKQPIDATLTALAALATATDKLIYATGSDTFATTTLTAYIRTLLAAADATAARTILGVDGQFSSILKFTASGTWTKPAGLKRIKVTVVGGGGGGSTDATNVRGGGGGGGAAIEVIEAGSLGATVTITVGGGGAAGAAGGTSSFGGFCSATGGSALGAALSQAGIGGIGSGGFINIKGGGGDLSGHGGHCAQGGSSILGGGGRGTVNPASYIGDAGGQYGGGGGGGAAGAAGIVIVEEFF